MRCLVVVKTRWCICDGSLLDAETSCELTYIDKVIQRNKTRQSEIAYKFKGTRFDYASMDGFVEARNYFYNKIEKKEINDK